MEVITLKSPRKNGRRLLSDTERWKEVQRSRIGIGRQKFATSLYEFALSTMMYLALNPFTAWFWAPFIYFLS